MALTDIAITKAIAAFKKANKEALKAGTDTAPIKPKRMSDSHGLYLLIKPAGNYWRYDYTNSNGIRHTLSLGVYPLVTLEAARKEHTEARQQVAQGIDPSEAKKQAKIAKIAIVTDTLASVVTDYLAANTPNWSQSHTLGQTRIIERDLLPKLGNREMRTITTRELKLVLDDVANRNTLGVLDKACSVCSSIWFYGVADGRATNNIASRIRQLWQRTPENHFAAILEPVRFGSMLRHINAYDGNPIVKAALQLLPLVFQRPGNLHSMRWEDIDLDKALWTIPSLDMKRTKDRKQHGKPHLVPLAKQSVSILRKLQPITIASGWVFEGQRNKRPISNMTLNMALKAIGIRSDEQVPHGFRASARTMLVECLNVDPLVIEAQLAHAVPDALGTAYNRTEYTQQRMNMVQLWADFCDRMAAGNFVDQHRKSLEIKNHLTP